MSRIGERLEVELPSRQKINKIKILLHDKLSSVEAYKYYSYKIETSLDGVTWELIEDFSAYRCKSWQTVYFKDRRVKLIGIVGTAAFSHKIAALTAQMNLLIDKEISMGIATSNHIHIVAIEAMLDTNTEKEDR